MKKRTSKPAKAKTKRCITYIDGGLYNRLSSKLRGKTPPSNVSAFFREKAAEEVGA